MSSRSSSARLLPKGRKNYLSLPVTSFCYSVTFPLTLSPPLRGGREGFHFANPFVTIFCYSVTVSLNPLLCLPRFACETFCYYLLLFCYCVFTPLLCLPLLHFAKPFVTIFCYSVTVSLPPYSVSPASLAKPFVTIFCYSVTVSLPPYSVSPRPPFSFINVKLSQIIDHFYSIIEYFV